MPIIIPSKKIYGEIDNPKVLENAIKKMEIAENNVSLIITDQNTDKLKVELKDGITQDYEPQKSEWRISNTKENLEFYYGAQIKKRTRTKTVELDRFIEDYYIEQISPSISGNFNVNVGKLTAYINVYDDKSITFDFDAETVSPTLFSYLEDYNYSNSFASNSYAKNISASDNLTIYKDSIRLNFIATRAQDFDAGEIVSSFPLHIVLPYEVSVTYEQDKITVSVTFVEEFTLYFTQHNAPLDLSGFGSILGATSIDFVLEEPCLLYNETIKYIDKKDVTNVLLNNNGLGEQVFSVGKNDFVRSNLQYDGVNGNSSLLYSKTLDLYGKGKETVKFRCDISEYYDEDGNAIISTKTPDKMMFAHYDRVVPMVKTSIGYDEPISYNDLGEAKIFEVVGIDLSYDGAVWQKLTLRETGESINLKRTTYTTLANKALGLTYKITSNQISIQTNEADGLTYIIGE